MPSDDMTEWKAVILAGIARELERMLADRGQLAPPTLDDPGLGDASFSQSQAETFAVGYDTGTGTTTMPFTLDVSILTDGSSGDLLTG